MLRPHKSCHLLWMAFSNLVNAAAVWMVMLID